jgi:3-hydroxyisobutyrate dehydrogenase
MGANVVRQGGPGAGQHTKMCNQIVIASTMMGVCEGLAYARRSGLDPQTVLASIKGGAAGSFLLDYMGPRMLQGDFAPGFFTEHFIKDMGIALQEAQRMNLELPGLALAKRLYDGLAAGGHGRDGTQVLFRHYEG